MNTHQILGPIVCVTIVTLFVAFFVNYNNVSAEMNVPKTAGKGFAVLELFTSEGCSSCPPADELMATIEKEAKGKAIYVLAYHVDYWNRLGWKDIFSDADYSKRQIQYGSWLNQPQIYTPQVIINGTAEFVGSDEPAIRKAISEQLAAKSLVTLILKGYKNNEVLNVQYQAGKGVTRRALLIAIVQKVAQSKVERGENAGHTLSHVQIVRKLHSEPISVAGSGTAKIELPKEFNNQNWEILGLVQDESSGEILGVATADLKDSANAPK